MPETNAAQLQPHIINQVPVVLEAWIGEARLTVGELAALKAGDVVSLGVSLNQAVALRLNDITIAEGELVAVGDQFGVRITAIAR